MNKRILFFLFVFSITPFLHAFKEPFYCKLSDQIVKQFVKEFAKPRGLYLNSTGGAMVYDVKQVILSFLSFDSLTPEEARVLYVEMMEEFLRRVNQDEKIRPYLHNYPFGPDNFDLMLGFNDQNLSHRNDGHAALVFRTIRHKEFYVEGYDSQKQEFYSLLREPYEESRRIVQESGAKFLPHLTAASSQKRHSSRKNS